MRPDVITLSKIHDIEPELIQAVVDVEGAGNGFFTDWDGKKRIKIQFEPHWFVRFLRRKGINARVKRKKDGSYQVYISRKLIIENKVDKQWKEWSAFKKAWEVDKEATMLATSWGLGQIMGFNAKKIGYVNVEEMITLFKKSELNQIEGMIHFTKATKAVHSHRNSIFEDLKAHDFHWFAYGYNGKSYPIYKYDERLEKAYIRYKRAP